MRRRSFIQLLFGGLAAAIGVSRAADVRFWPATEAVRGWRDPLVAQRLAEAEAAYNVQRALMAKARVYPMRETYWEL